MSTQPVTVESDGYSITSTHEDEASMVASLTPPKAETGEPRVIKPIPDEGDEPSPLSKAASELGKKGGEAAAKARKAAAKEASEDEGEDTEKSTAEVDKDGSEAQAEKDKRGNPRHDPTARVAQATREAKEAREQLAREKQEREALARRLEALERGRAPQREAEPPKPQAKGDEDPEPQEADFENYADYVKAVSRHGARQEWKAIEREQAKRTEQMAKQQWVAQKSQSLAKSIGEAKKSDPNFHERISADVLDLEPSFIVMDRNEEPSGKNWMADEFISAPDLAPAWMLHLSEHPQDYQRIAALSNPRDVTREMARLVIRQEAATAGASSRPEVSKAKPPVRPVTGSPHTADDVPGDDADYDTHVRYMNAKERRVKR